MLVYKLDTEKIFENNTSTYYRKFPSLQKHLKNNVTVFS